jgi:malate synthase
MDQILTPEALGFVAMLQRKFADRISTILQCRRDTQHRYDRGQWPNFPKETAEIRAAEWRVAPIPADLRDRRVEITGPVSRKMVINALNSGANVFMADFEDATSPTWANLIDGQVNLRDAVNRTITFEDVKRGKHYALGESTATLMVRPRGLHLPESHVTVAGAPVHASLFDFGLYFFHNAKALIAQGTGPYFYLPKLQHYLEARVWNDIFVAAQDHLGIPQGSIRATVLIETLSASFQMDEILWELRDHSAGLNCGRWDYIFSYIKTMQAHRQAILPDRSEIGMTQPFMSAYTQRVIQVCHRRGVHAMGGMAAQIPIKNDPEANDIALDKVREDKRREVLNGHDGTWVAHPALVAIAREVFDAHMPRPNQIDKKREDVDVSASDLLRIPEGRRTQEGLRHNLRIGVQYLEAWLRGNGCVPLYNLMEDAATAEISRTQVWQWVHHEAVLEDGSVVTAELVQSLLVEEMAILRARHAEGQFAAASALFLTLATQDELTEFLTLPAYEHIVTQA